MVDAESGQTPVGDREAGRESGLTFGRVLEGIGASHEPPIRLDDILVIRHSFRPHIPDAILRGPEDLTPERVLEETSTQRSSTRSFPADPPRYWVILVADGGSRARLYGTYEYFGERLDERTEGWRFFDLRPSGFLAPLIDRLVIDWSNPRQWKRRGESAAELSVLEIADRDVVPFPGFDRVRLTHHELREMVDDHRYAEWRAALREVQGIYLITDASNGKQYVGKADGSERLLGRWTSYAHNGHGGNVSLRQLAYASLGDGARARTDHARHFVFSILRVFGPSTSTSEVNAAESHYKDALMTRRFGLNKN